MAKIGIAGSDCGCNKNNKYQPSGIGEPITTMAVIGAITATCGASPEFCKSVGNTVTDVFKGIGNFFKGGNGCDRAGIFNRAHADRKYVEVINGHHCITTWMPFSALVHYRTNYPLCNVEGAGNWFLIWPNRESPNLWERFWRIYWAEGSHADGYNNEHTRQFDKITDWAALSEVEWTGTLGGEIKNRKDQPTKVMETWQALCYIGPANLESLRNQDFIKNLGECPPPVIQEAIPQGATTLPSPKPVFNPIKPKLPAAPPKPKTGENVQQAIAKEEKKESSNNLLILGALAGAYFMFK